jgi:hypothetical protein
MGLSRKKCAWSFPDVWLVERCIKRVIDDSWSGPFSEATTEERLNLMQRAASQGFDPFELWESALSSDAFKVRHATRLPPGMDSHDDYWPKAGVEGGTL